MILARPRPFLAATALIGATVAASAKSAPPNLLGRTEAWRTVVDGVMGGRSTADVGRSPAGHLVFTGELSLENNGGFSQIRTGVSGGLEGAKGIEIRVLGDGRTYKFDVRCANAPVRAGAYQQNFQTTFGEWTTISLPFDAFRLYSFGRLIRDAPAIDPTQIDSIGVTLADKKPGGFRLEIAEIHPIGQAPERTTASEGDDLVSVAERAGLNTLLRLISAADLQLPAGQRLTVFAPTDEAFAAIPEPELNALLAPGARDTLRSILTYHASPGEFSSSDLLARRTVSTLNGQSLPIAADGTISIGGAGVVAVDVPFDGGVIHVVDAVLMPEQRSIAGLVVATPELSTLGAAVDLAGVAEMIGSENGPWTVFAPVNTAFEALPAGALDNLLQPQNRSMLAETLGLHVVPGRIYASDLLTVGRARTLSGQAIEFGLGDGRLRVGEASIIASDIEAANGVVHLIDAVLLPEVDAPSAAVARSAAIMELCELAVSRGAPLFNDGSPKACAAVYEVAITAIISLGADANGSDAMELLRAARAEGAREQDWTARSWTYRRALDAVYRDATATASAGSPRGARAAAARH